MSVDILGTNQKRECISIEIEGLEEVQAELDTLADDLKKTASYVMCNQVGQKVQQWMQTNILREGLFRSGDLYRSIIMTVLTVDEGAVVEVGPDIESVPYAYIQNYGGTIPAHWVFPVTARALHWVQNGEDRFSKGHIVGRKKPIIIQARPYIEPAYDEHQEEIIETMTEVLNAAIAEEVATSGASSTWRG